MRQGSTHEHIFVSNTQPLLRHVKRSIATFAIFQRLELELSRCANQEGS
jgi:hypothetical protein